MKTPKVSIITCCYNHGKFLKKCVESVLNQTFKDFEIILTNDGSTDNTDKIAGALAKKDKRIRYFKNKKNIGLNASLNNALKKIRGKYFMLLSADDSIEPTNLEKKTRILDENQDVGIIYSDVRVVDKNWKTIDNIKIRKEGSFKGRDEFFEFLLYCYTGPNLLLRTKAIRKVGFFNHNLKVSEDRDLLIRISKYYKTAYIAEILSSFMQHEPGKSFSNSVSLDDCEKSWITIAKSNIKDLKLGEKQKKIIFTYVYYQLFRQGIGERKNIRKASKYLVKLMKLDPFFLTKRFYWKIVEKISKRNPLWIVRHDANKLMSKN